MFSSLIDDRPHVIIGQEIDDLLINTAGFVVGYLLEQAVKALIVDHQRNPMFFFIICAVGAVISIFGDLAASAIKREKGIKDYGTLIPGHGGIMDRFDSVIFTAPCVYLLTQIFLHAGLF